MDESIYDTLEKGFENNLIGKIANAITKLWNLEQYEKGFQYDEINVLCAYSNFSINYPKTGKNIELGKFQGLYDQLSKSSSKYLAIEFF